MSIKRTLHCDGHTPTGTPCSAYVGAEPRQPSPTQLRQKAAQLGWTKVAAKDYCSSCSRRRAWRTCKKMVKHTSQIGGTDSAMKSFIPWQGGKSKQAAALCQHLPAHTCYVEVFAGAANLLFYKPPSKVEVINDVNADLVNLFRIVRFHRRAFLGELHLATHSRIEFTDARAQPGLTDIQRAVTTYKVIKMAFGGKGGTKDPCFGYRTTKKGTLCRTAIGAITAAHKRLSGVHLESLDFADCIKRYDRSHTLFYCDPPYHETAGYQTDFTWADQKRLAAILRTIKGRFMLSINDHPDTRNLYKGLCMQKVAVEYSISRDKRPTARNRSELIVTNYRPPRQN